MPSAVNPGWMKALECIGLTATFLTTCGAMDARPTCVCASGDSWFHPYWVGECAQGGNPQVCTCPNGADFPVQS